MKKSTSLSACFLIATFLTISLFSGCTASEKIGTVGTELKDAGSNIVNKVKEIKSWFTTKADQAQEAADDIQEAADSINEAVNSLEEFTGTEETTPNTNPASTETPSTN